HQPNRRLRLAAEPQTGRREVSALTDARKTLAYDFFRILRAPRYLKKPPIAASRLAHYNGGASLSLRYLDHKMGETATETLTQRELVARLKQHIPEKFFKMVRYFGFLANRVCGEKLPQVYRALGMDKPEAVAKVCYAQMMKQFLSRDPFECVLCGNRMVYRRSLAGLNVSGLKKNARDISLLRYMLA
ncbi:transposase, partial [Escherichia coli]